MEMEGPTAEPFLVRLSLSGPGRGYGVMRSCTLPTSIFAAQPSLSLDLLLVTVLLLDGFIVNGQSVGIAAAAVGRLRDGGG